jgi:hypothetical protein
MRSGDGRLATISTRDPQAIARWLAEWIADFSPEQQAPAMIWSYPLPDEPWPRHTQMEQVKGATIDDVIAALNAMRPDDDTA